VTADLAWQEWARLCEPAPLRYASPGALAAALDPSTGTTAMLEAVDDALVELSAPDSPHDALAIFTPSQEGKSERVSRRFPAWTLDRNPALRIADVSYAESLAVRWGRAVRRDIAAHPCKAEDPETCRDACGGLHATLRPDAGAAGWWETPQGGGMYSTGIGGGLTGLPVDVLIIDDPVKDRAAAESATLRESTWEWWESVALTRLAPGARVVLVMTRWHMDDLAGRIFSRPGPLKWRVLRIPAIAENGDPIGRAPGEELPSVRKRAPGYFRNRQATMSAYVFSSVYQQNPTAAEGNFFRRSTFRYWRPAQPWPDGRERINCEGRLVTLADCWRFATVDVAASVKTSADWTVIAVWAVTPMGDLILLDRVRKRVAMHDHFALLPPLAARWGFTQAFVEHQFYSATLVQDARDAGYAIAEVIADKDKLTRAVPAAGRCAAGKAWFPAETSGCPCGECPGGVWLDEWCDELASFDKGAHDDQVDVFSYAAKVQVADWVPAAPELPRQGLSAAERAVADAYASATGDGGGLNILEVPY
jgi:predicted phage terminase large subunit-like protein